MCVGVAGVQEEKMDAVNEIRLLASVRHDNVIQYHEAFIDNGKLCIVMEYAEHGDLAKAIK
jgi:NIMA (never in mitosis gene a)-related kinase